MFFYEDAKSDKTRAIEAKYYMEKVAKRKRRFWNYILPLICSAVTALVTTLLLLYLAKA